MNIFVGNLNYQTKDQDLQTLFSEFGAVKSAKVLMDKFTGKSRGFGFVEMDSDEEANAAIQGLNETEFMSRNIVVNEAKPKEQSSGGGNRGGGNDFRKRY
jgi:RNA recognition motif-containing protein